MNIIWIILLITIALSFFFSGTEIAFISANKLKIELDRKNKKLHGRILSYFVKHPSDFVSTILVGNNISLVIYGMAMAAIIEPQTKNILPPGYDSDFSVMIIQTLISTLIILLLAEFIPKLIFRIRPNGSLKVVSFPLAVFYFLLYPVQLIFVIISELIIKYLFRIKYTESVHKFGFIDLDHYLKECTVEEKAANDLLPEIQMIQNTIDFRDLKVRECMIPRNEIKAIDQREEIQGLKDLFIKTGHSKILIYRENIDNIVGYALSYDIFKSPASIKEITKTILIVPETLPARELFKMFLQSRKHAAVVVDEFGGTSGMITLEDLLEEIIGEITDEFDKDKFTEKQTKENEYIFSGRIEIDYLNEKYKFNIPVDESYETLAGFILNHHENIPSKDDTIIINNYIFTIIKASDNKIELVKMKLDKA